MPTRIVRLYDRSGDLLCILPGLSQFKDLEGAAPEFAPWALDYETIEIDPHTHRWWHEAEQQVSVAVEQECPQYRLPDLSEYRKQTRFRRPPHLGQTFHIYRIFDATWASLYVGVSRFLSQRLGDHLVRPWGSAIKYVVREEQEYFSKREAEEAEAAIIKREEPKYNGVNNGAFYRMMRERRRSEDLTHRIHRLIEVQMEDSFGESRSWPERRAEIKREFNKRWIRHRGALQKICEELEKDLKDEN